MEAGDAAEWGSGFKGGFSATSEPKKVILSECRELVFVSGGISAKIQGLNQKYPELCWEYPATELVISSQMLGVDQRAGETDEERREVFGIATRVVSPVDFFLQPKAFRPTLAKLHGVFEEQDFEALPPFSEDQLFLGCPCLIAPRAEPTTTRRWVESVWRRGRLLEDSGPVPGAEGRTFLVLAVDEGWYAFVNLSELRPLPHRFARLPPLALHCRILGVDINDLEQDRVLGFISLVESECRRELRIRVERVGPTPLGTQFLVRVFHPTLTGKDLGAAYLPKPKPPPPQRPRTSHAGRIRNPNPGEIVSEDDDLSEEEDEEKDEPHLLAYDRMHKPAREQVEMFVSHVHNVRSFFLQSSFERRKAEEMSELLADMSLDPLPPAAAKVELACVIRVPVGRFERGLIRQVDPDGTAWVQSVDVGPIRQFALEELRCLPSSLDGAPLVAEVRLAAACDDLPQADETRILCDLLAESETWDASFPSRSQPPFKASLRPSGADPEEADPLEMTLARTAHARGLRRSWALVALPYVWRGGLPPPALPVPLTHTLPDFGPCPVTFRKGARRKGKLT